MNPSQLKCWSFPYSVDNARYSLEILAYTREEAERRVKAVSLATCEGEVMPNAASNLSKLG